VPTAVRRKRILSEARRLLAGASRPSVDAIASAAGVSKAAFYREFSSRTALLEELRLEPEAGARERILHAALELLGDTGLSRLSMDDVADHAEVSRATLYRLFPGKSALFVGVVREFSPLEPILRVIGAMHDEPPEIVMPEVARTVYRVIAGPGAPGIGLLRAIFIEVSSFNEEAEAAGREVGTAVVGSLGSYVATQMSAGRLRPVPPLIALQSFIGPIFFHLLTRPIAERLMGMELDGEQASTLLAESWLRAMKLDEGGSAGE
jgi:AcrR family transcriptional regulator